MRNLAMEEQAKSSASTYSYQVFIRTDSHNKTMDKALPNVRVTAYRFIKIETDQSSYIDSGYLALFKYNPNSVAYNAKETVVPSACRAIQLYAGSNIHILLIPSEVRQISLRDEGKYSVEKINYIGYLKILRISLLRNYANEKH
jgi:hypothetical protein